MAPAPQLQSRRQIQVVFQMYDLEAEMKNTEALVGIFKPVLITCTF